MSNLVKKESIGTIKKIRNIYLYSIIWILVAELVFWVVAILISNNIYGEYIGKAQTMFLSFVGCALLNIGAFKIMEIGNEKAQAFSVISIFTSIMAVILDVLLIWEVFPGMEGFKLSPITKLTLCVAVTALASLLAGAVMLIKDESKAGRIASLVCLAIAYALSLVGIISPDDPEKLILLIFVITFGSCLIWLVALLVRKITKGSSAPNGEQ